MPNRKSCYANMEKYSRTRKSQKQRYYNKTAIYKHSKWTPEHDKMVLDHTISDTELSKKIKHSVRAIQIRRYKLKN